MSSSSRAREFARAPEAIQKRIAEEAERKRRRDLELGINRIIKPQPIPLFKEAAQRVIEDKRRRRARNTGELYKYALKPIIEVFGGKLVCDISPEEIRAYQTRRLATGVSARTVTIEVGALRTVLKTHRLWAPIADAVEMLREHKDIGRALSYGDEKKLIEAAGKCRSPALLPLLIVTLDTELRAAEIRGLQRKHLGMVWKNGVIDNGFITVPKAKTEAGTGRTTPLSRRACAALTLWLSQFSKNDPDTFVFPRHAVGLADHKRPPHPLGIRFDEPIGQWKKAWKDACAAAGVRYRWHDLRHTFITRLAERPEISEQTIMSLAGHVSRSMLAPI
jgi:integrase